MAVYQKVPDADPKFPACDPKFPEDFKDILQIKEERKHHTTNYIQQTFKNCYDYIHSIYSLLFYFSLKPCVYISNILTVYKSLVSDCNPCVVNV